MSGLGSPGPSSGALTDPSSLLTSPSPGGRRMGPVCSVRGCAKQRPTKGPLVLLVLECQPAAGVRGRAALVPSPPWAWPQPYCPPGLACALLLAPGPAVFSLACPCTSGTSLPGPSQKDACMWLAGPRLPGAAGTLLLTVVPRRGPALEGAGQLPSTAEWTAGKGSWGQRQPELGFLSAPSRYSTAAQVHRPGPAQSLIPGGGGPRLVREGELLAPGRGRRGGHWQSEGQGGDLLLVGAAPALGSPFLLVPFLGRPFCAGPGIRCWEAPLRTPGWGAVSWSWLLPHAPLGVPSSSRQTCRDLGEELG